ncbi:MAG: hopanoid biosynthesis-associated protein HpnK [Candidatus Omnitrophica bacterium]|nr:hopanoid biosynthesis-associated protein HpnK [Candidatus Omnitrophota bacterium]
MRSVVFTGDDFGFSHGVNRAIIGAHKRGVLTRASLMVTGEAFDEAVTLARSHPQLGVGLHLVLLCGRSALPANEIPHLVDRTGQFPSQSVRTGLRYQFSSKTRRELRLEIYAQLEKFRRTGLRLSHVDGHLHMHMHPVALRILSNLAPEFGIKEIRLPSEELGLALRLDRSYVAAQFIWSLLFERLRRYGERCLKSAGIDYADRVYGLLASGRITEDYLLGLIPKIHANRIEIYSHPAIEVEGEPLNGPPGAGGAELAALVSERVRNALAASGFTLK